MANILNIKKAAAFITMAFFASSIVEAKENLNAKPILLEAPMPFTEAYTPEEFQSLLKQSNFKKRSPAQTEFVDENTVLSKQYMNIRNAFIGGAHFNKNGEQDGEQKAATTPEQIHELLNKVDEQMRAKAITELDAKLLASQLLVLKSMRGVVYRARNIFETTQGNATLTHAAVVTLLRGVAAGLDTYLPTDQWQAAFDYAVQPFYNGNSKAVQKACEATWTETCDIDGGPRFQAWLRNEVLPRLSDLQKVLSEIRKTGDKPIYMDNKILYSEANFVSSKDRFIRLGLPEKYAMLSATQLSMSSLYAINAYSLNGLFASIDRVARVYGFSAVFSANQATAKDRFKAVSKYPDLFRLKKENHAKTYLRSSYLTLRAGLQNAHLSWKALEDLQGNSSAQDNFIDPRLAGPFQRVINTGFANMFGIVGIDEGGKELGSGEVVSAVVNGEKVTVNLKKFFEEPPASLQDFFPTKFNEEGEFLSKKVGGTNIPYRNYRRGNPTEWNYSAFQKYFPGATNSEGVRRTARVMSQSWGGFIVGLPLNLVMM